MTAPANTGRLRRRGIERNPLLEAALTYARRGWNVFPCHSPTPRAPCSCRQADCASPAKHPRTRHGHRDATTDPRTIRTWWRTWPAANIGIATGAASGIIVVDIDPRHQGHRTLRELIDKHGALPATPVVATGGGGQHLWLAHPGFLTRNDAGRILGPGIDLRGDGGYILAPPSRHSTGNRYLWDATTTKPAPAPPWMQRLLAAPRPLPRAAPNHALPLEPGACLERELQRVRGASAGNRNTTLNLAAFNLGLLAQRDDIDLNEVAARLALAADNIGLGPREAERTISSGLRAGADNARPARETRREPSVEMP